MKRLAIIILILSIILLGSSCETKENLSSTIAKSSEEMAQNQKQLETIQPAPVMDYSLERENIIERTIRFNDQNKVSYIYLLSDYGTVISFFTIKGKVSNLSSYLVPDDTVITHKFNEWAVTVQAPDVDGSYGTNGEGIYFFTTDGTYVEWNGKYILLDKPLLISPDAIIMKLDN